VRGGTAAHLGRLKDDSDGVASVLSVVGTKPNDGGLEPSLRETDIAPTAAILALLPEMVEQITGRSVRAFLSQVTFDPDLSVEVFVLERDRSDPAPEGVA
jgi:hypothetical protein